jgi:type III secretion protein C
MCLHTGMSVMVRSWLHAWCVLILVMGMPLHVSAMNLPSVQWNVGYQNRPLNEVLTEVLSPSGYSVQISPQVVGTVSGRLKGTLPSVFDTLVRTFGLTWYFERGMLYVYTAAESRSQLIRLERASFESVQSSLDQLGLRDRRFELKFDPGNRTLMVVGPPRWVEVVTSVAMAADESSSSALAAETRVFPLRHARAADRTTGTGPSEAVMPGVVTLLQQLYGLSPQSRPALNGATAAAKAGRDTAANLYKQFLSTTGRMPVQGRGGEMPEAATDATSARMIIAGERAAQPPVLPQIQADVRTNSVIVRDYRERMPNHEAVIRQLDVPTRMVEIEAAIVEVTSDMFDSLGIDWRLSGRRVDIQTGAGAPPVLRRSGGNLGAELDAQAGLPASGRGTPTSPSGLVAVMAGGSLINQVLARVNALEDSGRGRVLSKPKVVTPENMEALIESTATYYVRLQGNLEVSLANVTVGTVLRVFPTLEGDARAPGIKLAIRIEDGSISAASVDNLPVVQRSTVTTEAIVGVGQTLLIGGMTVERDTDSSTGVPGLRRLPMVGRLFESEGTRRERMERIFLLTPRLVEVAP